MRILVALGLLLLLLLPLGCGPGGTAPLAPFSGGWWMTRIDDGSCGEDPKLGLPVSFSQLGSSVSMITPDATEPGSATGNTARVPGPLLFFDTVGGKFVTYRDILLERSGDVITATAIVRESVSLTGTPIACESGAMLKLVPEMRLESFNLNGVTDAPLNDPLILTFTQDVDFDTVTPDSIVITGIPGVIFDYATADGRRLALIPQVPNFTDLSDVGLSPATTYTLNLTDYLAPFQIKSIAGAPLIMPATAMFSTAATPVFVEPRRELVHTPGPFGVPPGMGDEDGCLNNPGTSLYFSPGLQTGSGAGATLLCLVNEGMPRVVPELCSPMHDDSGVGNDDVVPGKFLLPPLEIRFNEPLDPRDVAMWNSTTKLGVNVQLWHVGTVDATPFILTAGHQVETNRPLVVQRTTRTDIVLVAFTDVVAGTYLVNVRGLTDLPGNPMVIIDRPNPIPGGYGAIEATLGGVVPDGYRYYFRVD